jgi:ankyrin repeat protein
VKAHKVILCSQSSWFGVALEHKFLVGYPGIADRMDIYETGLIRLKEASQSTIDLKEDNQMGVQAMLRFFYGLDPLASLQSTKLSDIIDSIISIYATADKYDAPRLRTRMVASFKQHAEPAWLDLCQSGDLSKLIDLLYESTCAGDPLRSSAISFCTKNFSELRARCPDQFRQLLENSPDFAADIVMDIPQRSMPYKTDLHLAAEHGNSDLCTTLLNSINVDVRDENGETPLHFAAWFGHLECVKILVDFGAEVNATSDKFGTSTPLRWAKRRAHHEIIQYLEAKGAVDYDVSESSGQREQ